MGSATRSTLDPRDLVATVCDRTGVTSGVGGILNSVRLRGPIARAVNYHGTLRAWRDRLAQHFDYYAQNFRVLAEAEIPRFLSGELTTRQVALIITFDDGMRTNYEVAAKLLDEFRLPAIFLVPVAFIDLATAASQRQRRFFVNEMRGSLEATTDPDTYAPMSWDEVRDLLARGHAVGSHSMTHHRLGEGVRPEVLVQEIVESKRLLEASCRTSVRSFGWPFGGLADYGAAAWELVRRHYLLGFTTFAGPIRVGGDPHALHRSNVEPHMDLARVRAATQGLTELYFRSRRRRFEALVREAGC